MRALTRMMVHANFLLAPVKADVWMHQRATTVAPLHMMMVHATLLLAEMRLVVPTPVHVTTTQVLLKTTVHVISLVRVVLTLLPATTTQVQQLTMVLATKRFVMAIKYILARMVQRYQTQTIVTNRPTYVLQVKLCARMVLVLQEAVQLHTNVLGAL